MSVLTNGTPNDIIVGYRLLIFTKIMVAFMVVCFCDDILFGWAMGVEVLGAGHNHTVFTEAWYLQHDACKQWHNSCMTWAWKRKR